MAARGLRYIWGTRWLVDLTRVSEGEYVFIDLNTKRKCSTKTEVIPHESEITFKPVRFAVVSPSEILLMRMVCTWSKWALSLSHY
jgi:hypothetical protein